jgi:hypothetical protein
MSTLVIELFVRGMNREAFYERFKLKTDRCRLHVVIGRLFPPLRRVLRRGGPLIFKGNIDEPVFIFPGILLKFEDFSA